MRRALGVLLVSVVMLGAPAWARAERAWERGALLLGGGVTSSASADVRDVADAGFLWSLRLASSARRILGGEVHYTGSTQSLHAPGLDGDAKLLGTQLGFNLRFNLPLPVGQGLIAPFGFGGAGWGRYDLYDADFNASRVGKSDSFAILPLGAGLALATRGWMLDARMTYRGTLDDDLVRSADGGRGSLATWSAEISLGTELR